MTLLGPDISNYQKNVNLAASGAQFVIAKVSEGSGFIDSFFAGTMSQARAMGIPRGGYHFLHSGNGAAQCDFYLRLLGDPAGKLCALDVEVAGAGQAVPGFLDEFAKQAPGHPLLVYSNHGLWADSGGPDLSRWSSFVRGWHAGYQDGLYSPALGSLAAIWATTAGRVRLSAFGGITTSQLIQFTDKATIAGIGSGIDGNAWTGTLQQLQALTVAGTPAPTITPGDNDMRLHKTSSGDIYSVGGTVHLFAAANDTEGQAAAAAWSTWTGQAILPANPQFLSRMPVTPGAAPTVDQIATAVQGVLPTTIPATVDTAALVAAVVAALPAAPAGTLTAADIETAAETAVRAVLHNA